MAAFVETFSAGEQHLADPVERVVLAAPMAEGLVLHPAAALVELGVGVLDDVEWIGDLGDVRSFIPTVDLSSWRAPLDNGTVSGAPKRVRHAVLATAGTTRLSFVVLHATANEQGDDPLLGFFSTDRKRGLVLVTVASMISLLSLVPPSTARAAGAAYNRGNVNTARNNLEAFRSELWAQRGKHVTEATYVALDAAAEQLANSL